MSRALLLLLLAGACGDGVVINELMVANASAYRDPAGEPDDWIELYNPGDVDVDLAGWFFSDDWNDPRKQRLGAGLRVPAGGSLVLWADLQPQQGAAHLVFALGSGGEDLLLSDPDGTVVDDVYWQRNLETPQLEWEARVLNRVLARFPDGAGDLEWCARFTPGALNGAACADP